MPFWKIFTKRTTSQSAAAEPTLRYSFDTAKGRAIKADTTAADEKPGRALSSKGGFDPYNSGAFDRRGNWDKTKLK